MMVFFTFSSANFAADFFGIEAAATTPATSSDLNTGEFIADLENHPYIWNHKLENHHKRAKDEIAAMAARFETTGK